MTVFARVYILAITASLGFPAYAGVVAKNHPSIAAFCRTALSSATNLLIGRKSSGLSESLPPTAAQEAIEAELQRTFEARETKMRRDLLRYLIEIGYEKSAAEDHINTGLSYWVRTEKFGIHNLEGYLRRLPDSLIYGLPGATLRTESLAWLPKVIERVPYETLTELIEWGPIWLNSPHRLAVIRAILKNISTIRVSEESDFIHAGEILAFLLEKANSSERSEIGLSARKLIERVAEDFSFTNRRRGGVLSLVSLFPFQDLPKKFLQKLEGDWIDFRLNPPLQISTISRLFGEPERVGACELMFEFHTSNLQGSCRPPNNASKPTIVKVQGHVVGSIKRINDPSMLALRNVFDDRGRLVLVAGATYATTPALIKHIESGSVTELSLDRLEIAPNEFLLRHADITMESIWINYLEREVRSDLPSDFVDPSGGLNLTERNLRALWHQILIRINRTAVRLEARE